MPESDRNRGVRRGQRWARIPGQARQIVQNKGHTVRMHKYTQTHQGKLLMWVHSEIGQAARLANKDLDLSKYQMSSAGR